MAAPLSVAGVLRPVPGRAWPGGVTVTPDGQARHRGSQRPPRRSPDIASAQAAAAARCRSCRPAGCGHAAPARPGAGPAWRPSRASSSTCMASRIAPSISRSRSAGVMSSRSARSRKIAQVRWRAASTVSTVITVPTSSPGIPPGVRVRVRGFGPHRRPQACAALLLRRHAVAGRARTWRTVRHRLEATASEG